MTNQLFINDREIDLNTDVVFPLTYSISDVKEPQKRKRNSSKTIVLPGTQINNSFFQSAYDLNISDIRGDSVGFDFDPTLRYPSRVLRNGKEIFRGTANLQKVVQEDGVNEFHIVLYSDITNMFQALGDLTVAELGWEEYDHELSVANIQASWDAPVGSGYVYPLIDFGFATNLLKYNTNHLRTYVYVKEIIEKCFERTGFTLSGGFFNTAQNKKLIWGSGGGEILDINAAQIDDRLVDFSGDGTALIVRSASSTESFGIVSYWSRYDYGKVFNFSDNDDMTITLVQDTLGQMDEGTGELVLAYTGNYRLTITSNITIDYSFSGVGVVNLFKFRIELRIFRNFSKIASVEFNISADVINGSETFDLDLIQELELDTSDIITVSWFISTTGTKSLFDPGNLEINVDFNDSITFDFESLDSDILDGDTVNVARFLPKMKAKDFLQDMITMFNLYMNEPNDQAQILLVSQDQYYLDTDDTDNWSDKLDRKAKIEIMPASNIQGKTYSFKWAEDRDYYKQLYFETYGQGELDYGDYNYEVPSTFKVGVKKYQLKIAQSIPVQLEGTNIIIPRIVKIDEGTMLSSPHKGKPRMFFYNGKRASDDWQLVNSDTGVPTTFNVYPVAHHLNDIDTPTFDLNFGVPFWVYYEAPDYETGNLWTDFHAQFIRELTSKDSKMVNAFFRLTEEDLYENFQRRLVNIDGVVYRKNIIKEFRATANETTKVELLKIVAGNSRKNFQTNTGVPFEPNIDTGGDQDDPITGDTVVTTNQTYYPVDTSGGDVVMTFTTSMKVGKSVEIAKVTQGNKIILRAPGQGVLIDGQTEIFITGTNDSLTIHWDGSQLKIV